MIPLCLNLRNFMSYTDVHEPLRFDGIHVAVLSGDNGHGKSALLDAITWALWGQSRARTVDDLIHTGATEMEVEFEFLLEDQQYRVLRKRQKKGRTGYTDLQFAVLANGAYRPLTERSVPETEKAIERTLKMSYVTFTNSSFIQQGHADSFTTNQPAERKRILAEILELGYYDELEARAKDAMRQREAEVADERARCREYEDEIARKPEYEDEVASLSGELEVLEEKARTAEKELALHQERVVRLEETERLLHSTEERLQRDRAAEAETKTRLAETQRGLREARAVLERADAIEKAAVELASSRQLLGKLDALQESYAPLDRERERSRHTIEVEKARIDADLGHKMQRLTTLRQSVVRKEALERERGEAQNTVDTLRKVEEEQRSRQAEATRCREEAAEKRTVNRQLKAEMEQLRARIEELETLATCPSCQRPMDDKHKALLRSTYEAQGADLRERFRANERDCKLLDAAVKRDDEVLAQLAERLAGREAAQRRLAEAASGLAQIAEASQELEQVQAQIDELEAIVRDQTFAPEARQRLAGVEQQIATLAYDPKAHLSLRQRVAQLAPAEEEARQLVGARTRAEHLAAQSSDLEGTLARVQAEIQAADALCAELRQKQADLTAERERREAAEQAVLEARRQRDEVHGRLGQARQKLDSCAFFQKRLDESLARQDVLRREQGIYAELASALGKKGVQAMIIETAIPEIEAEANRLLSRMTDGRMTVKFETQRDVRSGTGTIETLDIKIADELGTRSYEMFSGGESFRVNFAIRIALSKLLANRAGTKLQTLVVDEGFASQDAEGRDRVVEAIQAIQGEFEKILVITHLDDLRDRFPVRIEIKKTDRGSTIALL